MRVCLVPPSLTVLGRIIDKRISITKHFADLRDWMLASWTLDDCAKIGLSRLRYVARAIPAGLAVACTEDDSGLLLWVAEQFCHPLCIVSSERKCAISDVLSKRVSDMKKIHQKYLTLLPAYDKLYSSGNFAQKKGTSHE
jgi:hypothetical protein